MLSLALGTLRALALCDLPTAALVALGAGALGLAARDLRSHAAPRTLALDTDGSWHLSASGAAPFSGRAVRAGYRGAAFLVLVLERERDVRRADDSRAADAVRRRRWRERLPRALRVERRHVPIHVDSVAPDDFSFLHLQLMLGGEGA